MLTPPKASIKRMMHNPNARVAQNYSIVEDLTQAPCAMSALEVLQSCLMQQNALLFVLGFQDPNKSNIPMSLFRSMLPTKALTSEGLW